MTRVMRLDGYSVFSRKEWSRLRSGVPMMLDERQLDRLRGANEPMSMDEVEAVYLPLVRLINLHVAAAQGLARVTDSFIGRPAARRPFVLAIAGSVAVGKSTVARLLQSLLSQWPDHPKVDLITTDGFLRSQAELKQRNLLERKGFPESYDLRQMIDFLATIRSSGRARAPVYSHQTYDLVSDEMQEVDQPDILIFEGLNVLQIGDSIARNNTPVFTAADFFDLSIYVDAEPANIAHWYVDRFVVLQQTRMQDANNHFHHLAKATEAETRAFGRSIWKRINLPNLVENILPTRTRADIVIRKRADHAATHLYLRHI